MSGWDGNNRFVVHQRGTRDKSYCSAEVDRNIGIIRVAHEHHVNQWPILLGKQGAKDLGMALIQLSNELPLSIG